MLLYLIKYSRPYISNTVRELSKATDIPNKINWNVLIRNLNFFVDTRMKALTYQCSNEEEKNKMLMLKAYCDFDFSGGKETKASVPGYFIYLHNCLIVWNENRENKRLCLFHL